MKEATHKTTIFSNYKKKVILDFKDEVNINDVFEIIAKEKTGIYVNAARKVGKHVNRPRYDAIKLSIMAFTPHGAFSGSDNKDLVELSGLIYLDVDDQEVNLEEFKSIPTLFACWKSISGTGYSLLFKAEGYTAKTINKVIEAIAKKYNIKLDNGAKALNRAVCISADPELYHNPDAIPFQFNGDEEEEETLTPMFSDAPLQILKPEGKPRKSKTDNNFMLAQDLPEYAPKYYKFAEDEIYTLYDQPAYTVELFKQRIPTGSRYRTLKIIAGKVIALYQNHSEAEAYDRFARFNLLCYEPLEKKELSEIFFTALKEYQNGVLAVATQKRQGKINPNMPEAVKKSAAGMMSGAIRRKKTKEAIHKAITTLQAEGRKVTQAAVSELTGKKIPTIKTYWKEFKPMVKNPVVTTVSTELRKAA